MDRGGVELGVIGEKERVSKFQVRMRRDLPCCANSGRVGRDERETESFVDPASLSVFSAVIGAFMRQAAKNRGGGGRRRRHCRPEFKDAMYHTCAERGKKECVYNFLQIRLREFGSWFHATWLRRLRPSLYVGKGGEARRGSGNGNIHHVRLGK